MKNVGFNQTERLEIRNRTIAEIELVATLTHTTLNTAFVGNPIDWSLVTIGVILKRNNHNIKIYQGPVLPVAIDSVLELGQHDQVTQLGTPFQVTYIAQSAGTYHVLKQTAKIPLHDVINVKDDDLLTIDVTPSSGAVLTTVNQSTSSVGFDVVDGIGNALSVPVISVDAVKTGESTVTYPGPMNCERCSFVNNDKAGITSALQVIQYVQISTDKQSRNIIYDQLLADRYKDFPQSSQADLRFQSFRLFDMKRKKYSPLDVRGQNVSVNIVYNSTNVNAGKNWLVWRSYVNDQVTLDRAKGRTGKHLSEMKGQYNP